MQLASLVCWSGFQEGDRWREAFLNKMSHLFDKLLQYVPVDGAADQVGRECEGGGGGWQERSIAERGSREQGGGELRERGEGREQGGGEGRSGAGGGGEVGRRGGGGSGTDGEVRNRGRGQEEEESRGGLGTEGEVGMQRGGGGQRERWGAGEGGRGGRGRLGKMEMLSTTFQMGVKFLQEALPPVITKG